MHIDVHEDLNKIDFKQPVSKYLSGRPECFQQEWTVDEATAYLRSAKEQSSLRYFYIVDDKYTLVGVISSHNLLMSPPMKKLREVMDASPLFIRKDMSVKSAIETLNSLKLVALPVIDEEKKLIDIIEISVGSLNVKEGVETSLQQKKTLYNDIFQLIGISIEKSHSAGVIQGFKMRMPWLLGNLVAGFACAAIAGYFQNVLQQAIILAMFIPLVLTLSESISMQSMTMSLNFLHTRKVVWKDVFERIVKECKTALLLGVTAGLAVEALAFVLHRDELPLFVVAISIFASMFVTATIGVIVPVVIHSMKLDPRVAGGPVALMFADTVATALYLGLATWWIL